MARLVQSEAAREQFAALEDHVAERLKDKLREAADDPAHHLERLHGYDLHKVRAGDHRAIVEWRRDEDLIAVHAVGHRSTIYDRELE